MNYYQAKINVKSIESKDHRYYDALITKRQHRLRRRYKRAFTAGQLSYEKGKLLTDCPYRESIYVVGWCDGYLSLFQ